MNDEIDFQIDRVTARYAWDRVLSTTTTTNTGLFGLMFGDLEHRTTTPAYRIVDALTDELIESNTDQLPSVWVKPEYVVHISGKSMPKVLVETLESFKGFGNLLTPKIPEVDIAGHTLYDLMVTEWDESTNTGLASFLYLRRWKS